MLLKQRNLKWADHWKTLW